MGRRGRNHGRGPTRAGEIHNPRVALLRLRGKRGVRRNAPRDGAGLGERAITSATMRPPIRPPKKPGTKTYEPQPPQGPRPEPVPLTVPKPTIPPAPDRKP